MGVTATFPTMCVDVVPHSDMTEEQKDVVQFYSGACIAMFAAVIAFAVLYNIGMELWGIGPACDDHALTFVFPNALCAVILSVHD